MTISKGLKKSPHCPLLDKDFIIDPYQIYLARYYGADAILLIAAILTDDQLLSFLEVADQLGLSVLVEVHTSEELNRVLVTKAPSYWYKQPRPHQF